MAASNSDRCRTEMTLSSADYDAVVLDLDGVITDTAGVHAAAWKATFDEYLASQSMERRFDSDGDYRRYVDGKPRYDGVESFLAAIGIELPYGDPSDAASQATVCGLGNRKNQLFQEKLATQGVTVYPASLDFIHALRKAGFGVAVATSSRNCQAVLAAAGITTLFDAQVDGLDLAQLGRPGKPAPDLFLEASRRLGTEPARTVGIEDASSGITALKAGGFGCVIGVGQGEQGQALLAAGADLIVSDLGQLGVEPGPQRLPSALDRLDEILAGRKPAVFLDYDGTLTPIVADPDAARLSQSMRATLAQLARLCPLAIISGRDLKDVQAKVGLAQLWYAGSHGFDIAGPEGQRQEHDQGRTYLPLLDQAEQRLTARLAAIAGCRVERKRYAIAIHYRQVDDADISRVETIVREVQQEQPGLRLATGKKIFELQPDLAWDKGRALAWLMDVLELAQARVKPLYIGDDVTDEDGFREVAADGAGIIVAPPEQPTRAAYYLADPAAVEVFLQQLCANLEAQSGTRHEEVGP